MPLEIFLSKSESCVNTILLRVGEEYHKHRYVDIGGDKICTFLTDDEIYKNFSKMGNNLTPYSVAIGKNKIYFLTPYFHFIKKDKFEFEISDDLFRYNLSSCENESLKKLQLCKIHSTFD